jgi:hypothetical protein
VYSHVHSPRGAKCEARNEPYILIDSIGLHLLVKPNGNKLWRLRYRFGGKQNMLRRVRLDAVHPGSRTDTLLLRSEIPIGIQFLFEQIQEFDDCR